MTSWHLAIFYLYKNVLLLQKVLYTVKIRPRIKVSFDNYFAKL